MPTIVDSLIVELGLDPKGFISGRQTAEREMRALKDLAQRASGASMVDQQNLRKQFDKLATSTGTSRDQLNNLWTDLRKNVAATSKPIDQATLSTRNLVTAGIAAYAAFKTVKGAIDSISASINSTIGTGFAARFSGTPVQWISAFSTAAFNKTGAAKEQTEAWVADLRTELEGFQTPGSPGYGKWTGRMNALAMMGLDATTLTRDPQELVSQISQHLSTLDPTRQRAAAQGLGLPDRLGAFMGEGRNAVTAQTAAAAMVAVTKEQTEKLGELGGALRSVDSSWDGLTRTITTGFAPAMTAVLTQFDKFLIDLQNSKERMDAFQGSVAKVTGGGIVGGLVGLLSGGFKGMLHGTWLGGLLGIGADVLSSPGTSFFPSRRTPEEEKEYRRRKAEETNAIGKETPPLTRMWNWMTGRSSSSSPAAGASAGAPAGGAPGEGGGPITREDVRGLDPETAAAAMVISRSESRQGNVWNYKHNERPNYYTASGWFQMTRSNWRKYGEGLVDLDKYPDAITAPKPLQLAVFSRFHKAEGNAPWRVGAAGGSITSEKEAAMRSLAAHLRNEPTAVAKRDEPTAVAKRDEPTAVAKRGQGPGGQFGGLPPNQQYNSKGQPVSPTLGAMSEKEFQQQEATRAWIKSHPRGVWGTAHAAQIAASGGGNSNTVNHGDMNVNVGDIHTQANDAASMARDLKKELQDQFSVTHSNVGIE